MLFANIQDQGLCFAMTGPFHTLGEDPTGYQSETERSTAGVRRCEPDRQAPPSSSGRSFASGGPDRRMPRTGAIHRMVTTTRINTATITIAIIVHPLYPTEMNT